MNTTDKLQVINNEPRLQKRIKLLVDHGYKPVATKLLWDLVRTCTVMFYYEWHDRDFCRPLPRMTSDRTAVYVIITTSGKLDYISDDQKEGQLQIIFELGWERNVLGWTAEESMRFCCMIFAQALIRPLNQWSLKQAEGTGRAARSLLSVNNSLAREIAASHLVFHLRQADFGHITGYLMDIPGFTLAGRGICKEHDNEELIKWIVDQLLTLGWTPDRIRKELVEWIWLKTNTHPQWLLAVSKAQVFDKDDPFLALAVRRWINQRFDDLLDSILGQRYNKELIDVYRQLLQIGQIGVDDESRIVNRLVNHMALGKVSSVKRFVLEFSGSLGFGQIDAIQFRAITAAKAAGNYGIAVALIADGGFTPQQDLNEIVKLRSLTTTLE